MTVVIEEHPVHKFRTQVRIVLDQGEIPPTSLLDIRVLLRRAIADLPNDIRQLTIISDRRKSKGD